MQQCRHYEMNSIFKYIVKLEQMSLSNLHQRKKEKFTDITGKSSIRHEKNIPRNLCRNKIYVIL